MKKVLIIALSVALVASFCIPAAVSAWSNGDTQTQGVAYNFQDRGGRCPSQCPISGQTPPATITEDWVWTVLNASATTDANGNALPVTCTELNAAVTPTNYSIAWSVPNAPNGAAREAFTAAGGATPDSAVIDALTNYNYLAVTDGRAIRTLSTQYIFGGFFTNTVDVGYTYGPSYPSTPFTLTVATAANNPVSPMSYTDTFNVYPNGTTGAATLAGCSQDYGYGPGVIPTYQIQWDWTATTNPNAPPGFPKNGVMLIDQAVPPIMTLLPLGQVDTYHFTDQETQTALSTSVGGSPCPPIPEVATIVLLSVGVLGLAGFVWFRRRHAAAAAA